MREIFKQLDYPNRRRFVEYAAKAFLGVSILPSGILWADDKTKKPGEMMMEMEMMEGKDGAAGKKKKANGGKLGVGGKAKNVIYIFMEGAMSHIDTFDPKTDSEIKGPSDPIATKASGMKLANRMEKLAQQAGNFSVINSMYTETADHEKAQYLMHTSYKQIATIRHPAMGAWAYKMLGTRKKTIPDNIVIGGGNRHPGAGYMDPAFTPVPIGDPNRGLENTKGPSYLTEDSFEKRIELINTFDKRFQTKFPQKQVQAYNDFYRQAVELMSSSDLKCFDLNQEAADVRDKYGRNTIGQGLLLARRLVESDVRFVEVSFGSWDMHNDIDQKLNEKATQLDQALATLLEDLKSKGLLDSTLVVLTTEFGRTPKINENDGRDHHPAVFSSLMAGAGIKGGYVHGTSDKKGATPNDNPVSVQDFNATIAKAMGISNVEEIHAPNGRPFKVADDGTPVDALFA